MSAYNDAISGLVSVIKAVPNTGNVYNRTRYSAKWDDYLSKFAASISGKKVILGWFVTQQAAPSINPESSSAFGVISYLYKFKVTGIKSFQDTTSNSTGSETEFTQLVESVIQAINSNKTLNISQAVPFSIVCTAPIMHDLRQFGSVLCDYCELQVDMEVQVPVSYV